MRLHPTHSASLVLAAALGGGLAFAAQADDLTSKAEAEGKVIIYSTTDTKAAAPLIAAFEAKHGKVKVEYHDMNSTELYNRYISEQAAGGGSADLLWSSSMDSAMRLATRYADSYESPEIPSLPEWAVWNNAAFGTTYEPIAFIYNTRLIKEDEVPRTHAALAELVKNQPDRFRNKVTTYDIEKSAVGYMLAAQDNLRNPDYLDFIKGVGAANLVLQSSTGTMMERVSPGENLIGYNLLGSYAETRAANDPSIGIVYPADYTPVLSRVAFVSKKAANPNAARLFLDFMLSAEGQGVLANQSNLTSIREDVEGDNDVKGLTSRLTETTLVPIPVDESLLQYLEQKERLAFIRSWRNAAGK
ncbi:ABC transporter substrate-binding protein [Kerstersia gyiorum]|uniref:ABC transporter substrate-binding protein n=1 Tax=Kerstersia gyiorum TaxID=206506 RepID=UPI00209CB515|nr:ABC transporter substrate-binding protein [Kerstersia gyiorum]MCP1671778.1 iron(III) transport system substrate-binding protein [Kerstersia gyiorum]MCP1709952.1 iron(III) transport system substrate-binding protein [Kerstersia gyiorum]